MDIVEVIRNNVRFILSRKKMTQSEFASRLKVSTVYLSDLLNGRKGQGLKVSLVQEMCDILGVKFSELTSENLAGSKAGQNKFMSDAELDNLVDSVQTYWSDADLKDKGFLLARFEQVFNEYEELLSKRSAELSGTSHLARLQKKSM